ncbi:MAG TPA: lipopolysaccharide transport periplasmic protein LptA [Steroidobacteraceae bacterium]|nr:lipopolysaccharide transport periplasmic protein LptA [Steroidobacteraceae bacterium]
MARSCLKARWLLPGALAASAATAVALSAAAGPAAQPAVLPSFTSAKQLPITLDAASSDVDYKTHTYTFEKVVISQGTMRVQADHARATGLDFANSHWTFDGHVHIDAEPRGNLRSDQAVVEFKDNRIARATVTGKPAEFEQRRLETQQLARGHADQIVYDVNDGTVRLTDDAWLSDGQNEISGPLLVYNINQQRVQAGGAAGSSDQRVHITIAPQTVPSGKGKSEPGKPQPNPP